MWHLGWISWPPPFLESVLLRLQNQVAYTKKRSHLKPFHKIQQAQLNKRCPGYSEGLMPSEWYWELSVKYDPVWPYKLDVINNWYTLYNRKNTEKSMPHEETVLLWHVTRRQTHTVWGPVHTKAGWSGECMFPAQGSGKAQLEEDIDLRIRGWIWTA